MSFIKEIYKNKSKVNNSRDLNSLSGIVSKHECVLNVEQCNDNVLLVSYKDKYEDKECEPFFEKYITKWLKGLELSCPIEHLYNIMPLNPYQYLIKI